MKNLSLDDLVDQNVINQCSRLAAVNSIENLVPWLVYIYLYSTRKTHCTDDEKMKCKLNFILTMEFEKQKNI